MSGEESDGSATCPVLQTALDKVSVQSSTIAEVVRQAREELQEGREQGARKSPFPFWYWRNRRKRVRQQNTARAERWNPYKPSENKGRGVQSSRGQEGRPMKRVRVKLL